MRMQAHANSTNKPSSKNPAAAGRMSQLNYSLQVNMVWHLVDSTTLPRGPNQPDANYKDSTESIFVGMAQSKLEQGEETEVTPIYWRSEKIDRTCRSPLCAETMASLDGENDLLYLRVLWNEMQGGTLNPRYPNEFANHTRGLLITDARNHFD